MDEFTCKLILNDKIFEFPSDIELFKKIKSTVSNYLINKRSYEVQSTVRCETFQLFLNYWKNEIDLVINESNIWEFTQLNNEFGLLEEYLSSPDIEQLFNISNLLHSDYLPNLKNLEKYNYNKSFIEQSISHQLDKYIAESPNELSQIPLTSLYNIFFNKERVLNDHDQAYLFIINNQNQNFFLLIGSLDANKFKNSELLKDSISKRNEHFGFCPQNLEIIENKINEYVEKQKERIENFGEKIDKLSQEFTDLSCKLEDANKKIKDLESKNAKISKENIGLNRKLNSISARNDQLRLKNSKLLDKNKKLELQLQKQETLMQNNKSSDTITKKSEDDKQNGNYHFHFRKESFQDKPNRSLSPTPNNANKNNDMYINKKKICQDKSKRASSPNPSQENKQNESFSKRRTQFTGKNIFPNDTDKIDKPPEPLSRKGSKDKSKRSYSPNLNNKNKESDIFSKPNIQKKGSLLQESSQDDDFINQLFNKKNQDRNKRASSPNPSQENKQNESFSKRRTQFTGKNIFQNDKDQKDKPPEPFSRKGSQDKSKRPSSSLSNQEEKPSDNVSKKSCKYSQAGKKMWVNKK